MTKEENAKFRTEFFEEYSRRCKEIEEKAKAEGTWCYYGLDSNNHLFKELRKENEEKLRIIREKMKSP